MTVRHPCGYLDPMLSREELIDALSDLRRATVADQRSTGTRLAPYKPLTLLWAIGRLWRDPGSPRLVPFTEAREGVRDLCVAFGRLGDNLGNIINPLWRLQGDANRALWECRTSGNPLIGADGVPTAGELVRTGAEFGLSEQAHRMLRDDIPLRLQAGQVLAAQVCPASLWGELFDAIGAPHDGGVQSIALPVSTNRTRLMATRLSRDPRFRVQVLEAYGHRCVVCGASPQLGAARFGIEAAHIQWVTEDGPDDVRNGLALCAMHHRGLDRGAFTLTDAHAVQVSPHLVRATAAAADHFWRFNGTAIEQPAHLHQRPLDQYIHWHRKQVFVEG